MVLSSKTALWRGMLGSVTLPVWRSKLAVQLNPVPQMIPVMGPLPCSSAGTRSYRWMVRGAGPCLDNTASIWAIGRAGSPKKALCQLRHPRLRHPLSQAAKLRQRHQPALSHRSQSRDAPRREQQQDAQPFRGLVSAPPGLLAQGRGPTRSRPGREDARDAL